MSEQDDIIFKHIAIEGVLRSGKTRLAGIMAKRLGGKTYLDREENPYLKDFYDEKEGAAFLTQLVYLVNRYHQQAKLLQRNLFDDRVICDYLFEKDKIYAYQTLADDELLVYEKIFSVFSDRVAKPDLVVFLQLSLPTLQERLSREGTPLEKNISEKYLEDIVEAFNYFFFNYQASPLLVVKADELDFNCEEDINDLLEKIRQMKKSPLFYVPLSRSPKKDRK